MKKGSDAIRNFLADRYSKKDYLEVISQFEKDDSFEELKAYLEKYWEEEQHSNPVIQSEDPQILLKIQQQILKQTMKKHQGTSRKLMLYFSKIAAVLIIPVLLAGIYFYIQWQKKDLQEEVYAEIYCPPGTRSRFNLPDGSTGWLNSDSYLKYPVRFQGNRTVELSGEAFFNVAKNRNSPFRVHAEGLQVEALGTQFNVMAYPDWPRTEVSLEEGSVKVSKAGTNLNEILVPNQRLVFSRAGGTVAVNSGDTGYFTSWKDGYLVFRNVPLEEVAVRLSRWYNSEITILDSRLKSVPFRATFRNESLERVLSLLAISTPISYQINESITNKDGTYEKQKVTIRSKN